jgi:tetratricopeptide (TPR) repeat protein
LTTRHFVPIITYMVILIVGVVILAAGVVIFLALFSGQEKRLLSRLAEVERNKKFGEAIEIVKKLIDIRQKNAFYHLKLALLHEKNKNNILAIQVYEKMESEKLFSSAISRQKVLESSVTLLLNAHLIEKAYIATLRLLAADKGNVIGLIAMARILGGQGVLDDAMRHIEQAVALAPNNPEARFYYALVFLDKGDIRNATMELQSCLKLNRNHPQALYFLAIVYVSMNYPDEAEKVCKLINTDPATLPKVIVRVGIMKQKMPKLDLEDLKARASLNAVTSRIIRTMSEFMTAPTESFQDTATSIIGKLGYTVKQEIKDSSIDHKLELHFIGTSAAYPDGCYIQFLRNEGEVGFLLFSEFIHRIEQQKLPGGVFITTADVSEAAKKMDDGSLKIHIVDRIQLRKYLR